MSKPLASVTLTPADLFHLAAPRLLTENPFLPAGRDWVFGIVTVPDGIRIDVLRPAGESDK